MKSTGITRHVDKLDRIVIPRELCKTFEILPKNELELYVEGETIIIKKHTDDGKANKSDTGIVRHIDDLGRVVIPKEVCKRLKIEPKDMMEIFVDGTSFVLKKSFVRCVLCGNKEEVVDYKGNIICKSCINDIKNL